MCVAGLQKANVSASEAACNALVKRLRTERLAPAVTAITRDCEAAAATARTLQAEAEAATDTARRLGSAQDEQPDPDAAAEAESAVDDLVRRAAVVDVGVGCAAVMAALVAFSSVGAVSGIVLAGPRAYLPMAEDGLLFRWAREVHPTFRTPHRTIVVQAVWAAVLIATGSYRVLVARVIYTEWIFFALMALGVVVLRRRAAYAPSYRVPLFPALPLAFAAVAIVIVANQIAEQPLESAAGLLLVVAGWPVYHLWVRRPATPSRPLDHGD